MRGERCYSLESQLDFDSFRDVAVRHDIEINDPRHFYSTPERDIMTQ